MEFERNREQKEKGWKERACEEFERGKECNYILIKIKFQKTVQRNPRARIKKSINKEIIPPKAFLVLVSKHLQIGKSPEHHAQLSTNPTPHPLEMAQRKESKSHCAISDIREREKRVFRKEKPFTHKPSGIRTHLSQQPVCLKSLQDAKKKKLLIQN